MFKGFYNLTSGMLTQQRNLNVVAQNLTNVSTAGFKEGRYTSSTFDDVLYSRVGNKYKGGAEDIGRQSYIRASSQVYTDYAQGALEPTAINLDFAIEGDGFFAIQTEEGDTLYTRTGSFSLDEEGYLWLGEFGRVMSVSEEPIYLGTDKITADSAGRIFTEEGGFLGQLGVFDFEDYAQLRHNEQSFFVNEGGEPELVFPRIHHKYLERSNVDVVNQMTDLISSQRAMQSAAQVSRMYDDLMGKAVNDIGRL